MQYGNYIQEYRQSIMTVSNHLRILSRVLFLSLAGTLAVFTGAVYAADETAPSSVWVISSGDDKVYLGGTVHLLRASDYPLPPQYEQAYQDSDMLYFETDINGMNDISVQTRMMQQLTYQDERTLQSVLSEEAYATLAAHMETVGLPIAMVQKFKPGLLTSTLTVIEMQKMGFTPQGVDSYYSIRAMGDGKPVGQLETLDEQIGFLADMGEGNESEFILMSLRDLQQTEMMDQMIQAWRTGNDNMLSELFIDEMKNEAPELYDSLLVERNNNWLPLIEAMFQQEGTEFVLVGAAHLVGDDGLLKMLEDKGYEASRL